MSADKREALGEIKRLSVACDKTQPNLMLPFLSPLGSGCFLCPHRAERPRVKKQKTINESSEKLNRHIVSKNRKCHWLLYTALNI